MPFNSVTARHAVRRRRSLKGWRTRIKQGTAELDASLYVQSLFYARQFRWLYRLLRAIQTRDCSNVRCKCSLHQVIKSGLSESDVLDAIQELRTQQHKALAEISHQHRAKVLLAALHEDNQTV
jgi:hypothetical protein